MAEGYSLGFLGLRIGICKGIHAGCASNAPLRMVRHFNGRGKHHHQCIAVEALNAPDTLADAAEAIRGLIEAVRLMPEEGELKIEIYGELAALITLGQNHKNKHPGGDTSGVQLTLVAGAHSHLYRTSLKR